VLPQSVAKLSDEQRRALQLLARSPNGCTEVPANVYKPSSFGSLPILGTAQHGSPSTGVPGEASG